MTNDRCVTVRCDPSVRSGRARFNAVFFSAMDGYIDRHLRVEKRRVFANLPDTVLEIGPGVGANLRYLRPGTRLIAVEPNPHMHSRLRANAVRHHITLDLRAVPMESLDLPLDSIPAVISSLVLCSVEDPAAMLAQVQRILAPGGRFAFAEHVAGPDGTLLRGAQRTLRRPWTWLFDGCSCERDLASVIEQAGFAEVDLRRYRLRSPFVPFNAHIAGVAVKR